jgi:Organic solvent tolerance protein OstA
VKHKILSFNLEGLNEKGTKKWDVKGESAEAISETEVMLDNIVAKAYGEEAQAVITADKGVYDKSKNNVRLQKNVKATIESKSGFTGGLVDFSGQSAGDAAKEKTADKDQKKTKTVITCDGEVLFDYEQNIAIFVNNVHVDSEDGSIIADKITVHLDPDSKQMKEIIAEGNVKIKRGENLTYSEKATYDAVTKKVSLVGRPKLVLYQEGGSGGFDTNFMGDMAGKK